MPASAPIAEHEVANVVFGLLTDRVTPDPHHCDACALAAEITRELEDFHLTACTTTFLERLAARATASARDDVPVPAVWLSVPEAARWIGCVKGDGKTPTELFRKMLKLHVSNPCRMVSTTTLLSLRAEGLI